MESRFISCEPNYLIPEYVTIAKLKNQEDKTKDPAATFTESDTRNGYASKEELRQLFSFKTNEYLRCKWNKFLDNIPKEALIIRPYLEYNKKPCPVRKKILKGSFFLDNGELSPVACLRDPRK